MPSHVAMITIIGNNQVGTQVRQLKKTVDLKYITIQRATPSLHNTWVTVWLDSLKVYPLVGPGTEGERSEGVIHHHPLPRIRAGKGQDLIFQFNSGTLPSSACETQTAIITVISDYVPPDEAMAGKPIAYTPYVVETYKTEDFFSYITRKIEELNEWFK